MTAYMSWREYKIQPFRGSIMQQRDPDRLSYFLTPSDSPISLHVGWCFYPWLMERCLAIISLKMLRHVCAERGFNHCFTYPRFRDLVLLCFSVFYGNALLRSSWRIHMSCELGDEISSTSGKYVLLARVPPSSGDVNILWTLKPCRRESHIIVHLLCFLMLHLLS